MLVIVSVVGLAACGGDTPARAVYSLAHDLEHGLTDSACSRILPAAALSRGMAQSLDMAPTDAQGRESEDDAGRACERRLGGPDEVALLGFHEPRVHSVRDIAVVGDGAITAAARAQVAFDGDEPVPVPLVEVDGEWRVVLSLVSEETP